MNELDAVLLLSASAGAAGVGVGIWSLKAHPAELRWRELQFPSGLEASQVETVLDIACQSGRGPIVLRVDADHEAIRFGLAMSPTKLATIEQAIAGIAPALRLVKPTPNGGLASDEHFASSVRLNFSGRWPLLRSDQPELAVAALLGSLNGLSAGERIRLQLVLTPSQMAGPSGEREEASMASDQLRLVRQKSSQRLLRMRLVVAARSGSPVRERQLLDQVATILASRAGLRGQLRRHRIGQRTAQKALATNGQAWWTPSTDLSSSELVGLIGWPIGDPQLAKLRLGTAPSLPAPPQVPSSSSSRSIRNFGISTHPSQVGRHIGQPIAGGLRHTVLVGGTGTGKSTLLSHLVEQDLAAGRGCLVVDAKGDLVDDLLERIPERRLRDVILLDPARDGAQPGLRLMPARGRDIELSADLVAGTFQQMWPTTYGVRSAQYLRMGLVTLGYQPQASLVDLPTLLTDRAFRHQALSRVPDRLLLSAWQRFESMSAAEQAQHIASPLSKIDELVSRRRLRTVLGQGTPKLNFAEVLGNRRIVLVRLPAGSLGAPAAQLLASLVLWQFLAAVEARAELPSSRRSPFFVYLDEIKALANIGLPIADLLERARGLGVGLNLAPQALSQLPVEVQKAMLANVGSLVCFKLASDEAKRLASDLPGVDAEGLGRLGQYEVAVKLALSGAASSPVMTARTVPPSRRCSDPEIVRKLAQSNWGAEPEEVDAELVERLGLDRDVSDSDESSGPIGTRRRRP